MTEITAKSIDDALRKQLDALKVNIESREVGTVIQIGDGIARVDGLRDAMAGELLEFVGQGGKTVYGLAHNLEEDATPCDASLRKKPKPIWTRTSSCARASTSPYWAASS